MIHCISTKCSRASGLWLLSAILVTAICCCTGCAPITPVPVTLLIDGRNCMLNESLRYRPKDSNQEIAVPAGFVSDFASVPRIFYAIYTPTGRYQWAAVVHDYLYWEQSSSREDADRMLLKAMEESGVGAVDRRIIYDAVRLGGATAWNTNKKEKERGLPRIIPPTYRKIPPNTTWEEYRQLLYEHGVRP